MTSRYLDEPLRSPQEVAADTAFTESLQKRRRRHTIRRDGPHPVDIHVGSRVRLRRVLCGLTQEKLAERIGFTFQQLQKYERGANRISASVLYSLSAKLDVPVSFFFDGLEGSGQPAGAAADQLTRRETLELVRNFYGIPDEALRDSVYGLVKTLATTPSHDEPGK